MIRTPAQRQRRRALLSAAAARTAVVLYACAENSSTAAAHLGQLRRHAAARDWQIAREITDVAPSATPLDEREQWPEAREAIRSGEAEGIVIAGRCENAPERDELTSWLGQYGAFLSIAQHRVDDPAAT